MNWRTILAYSRDILSAISLVSCRNRAFATWPKAEKHLWYGSNNSKSNIIIGSSLIYWLSRYILSIYYMPGTVLPELKTQRE